MIIRRQFIAGLAVATGTLAACQPSSTAQSSEKKTSRTTSRTGGTRLTQEMLEDALTGSSYLGCGGGGGLQEARDLIAGDLASGHIFKSITVDELSDTDRVACPYGLGSIAPGTEMSKTLDALDDRIDEPVQAAFELLERHLETKFSGVILGEIGPLSLAEGLSIAARLGVPALDADTVGRATPEINQHSVRVAGYPLTPAAGATQFGDEVIVGKLGQPSRGEDIFRALSVASGIIGVVDAPITGDIAKRKGTLVTGSLTLAMDIGRAVREAKAAGIDPIEAARVAGDGYKLFEGRVGRSNWADADGFLEGDVIVAGTGPYAGQSLHLDYKNEHLVAKRNGKTIATCPDLITMIDKATADGINNPDFIEGQEVAILGFRCDPLWRTEAGLEVFSPSYFGYDEDYVPIETRLGI